MAWVPLCCITCAGDCVVAHRSLSTGYQVAFRKGRGIENFFWEADSSAKFSCSNIATDHKTLKYIRSVTLCRQSGSKWTISDIAKKSGEEH